MLNTMRTVQGLTINVLVHFVITKPRKNYLGVLNYIYFPILEKSQKYVNTVDKH